MSCAHIRRLTESDCGCRPLNCGVDALDRITWEDRIFDMNSDSRGKCTYLLEQGGNIRGFLTVNHLPSGVFNIDEIAVDETVKGSGYGPILLRFADTLARHLNCFEIRLRGIEDQVGWYEKFGYQKVENRPPLVLDKKKYFLMKRPVLFHMPLSHL